MKKLISLILTLLLIVSTIPAASAAGTEQEKAAETLYELGLFRGTGTNSDGTPIFDLEKTPTRNQAVIMLVRLLGKEEEALAGNWNLPFTDVAKGSTAYPYIGYAYANGLTNGTSATTYSGTKPIKANQYITFVLRALGYTSGKDFSVGNAWEFSDTIGLTDGRYSTATINFTRGDVAVISCSALSIHEKGTVVPLQQKLEEEKQGGHRAWFYVDEMGGLSIRTNIDSRNWGGYSVISEIHYRNGGSSWDEDRGQGMVRYVPAAFITHHEVGTVITSMEFYVFKGICEELYDCGDTSKTLKEMISDLSDQFVCKIELANKIFIKDSGKTIQLEDVTVSNDSKSQKNTYTLSIVDEILETGLYDFHFTCAPTQNRGGNLKRENNVLMITLDSDFFPVSEKTGEFHVTHSTFSLDNNGTILCQKTTSNRVPAKID